MNGREKGINMATKVRSEVSTKNRYWISKHRYYELKHFCLQYPTWKKVYATIDDAILSSVNLKEVVGSSNTHADLTAKYASIKAYYSTRTDMIEKCAKEADEELCDYILRAVTEELSYTYLKSKLEIPCSRDTYYDRYRKFFWLLSKERG